MSNAEKEFVIVFLGALLALLWGTYFPQYMPTKATQVQL